MSIVVNELAIWIGVHFRVFLHKVCLICFMPSHTFNRPLCAFMHIKPHCALHNADQAASKMSLELQLMNLDNATDSEPASSNFVYSSLLLHIFASITE